MGKETFELPDRFRLAVDSIYLTRADAAKDLGISAVQVGNISLGKSGIGIKTLQRLLEVGINPDWVLHGKGTMLTDPKKSRFYQAFADMFAVETSGIAQPEGVTEQEGVIKQQKEVLKELRALVLELRAASLRARED